MLQLYLIKAKMSLRRIYQMREDQTSGCIQVTQTRQQETPKKQRYYNPLLLLYQLRQNSESITWLYNRLVRRSESAPSGWRRQVAKNPPRALGSPTSKLPCPGCFLFHQLNRTLTRTSSTPYCQFTHSGRPGDST